jgi:hypothetical protein
LPGRIHGGIHMSGYLWRRGSRFWFQIAVPGGARHALGSTPIRIPLPCDHQADAARYARRLAGVAEGWFMSLYKKRFTGLTAIAASSGNLENARERLHNQLIRELREITSQAEALGELRKPHRVTSKDDLIANLQNLLFKKALVSGGNVAYHKNKERTYPWPMLKR